MPRICYVGQIFNRKTRKTIDLANEIIREYAEEGYDLTLRQLYYQFVSRDILPNTQKSYARLGRTISRARLAGFIDWNRIVDRTRGLHSLPSWSGPAEIVESCARQFRLDKWRSQPARIEVWIEKQALSGVFQRICDELQVPFFACRGYTSQSEMWVAGQRLKRIVEGGQGVTVLHFGDHDPSGIDMTRDIEDRLEMFMGGVTLERAALNMDQVEHYGPPPNPAKVSDSRAAEYIRLYGRSSWELDALEPSTLSSLVRNFVIAKIDDVAWKRETILEETYRKRLARVAEELAGNGRQNRSVPEDEHQP